jgi:glycosyltransferase involved in cell wall biosynthesis
MLEAMAAGAPIAASATAPVTEVIEHEVNGLLFDFFDQDALVASVCRLLDDRELRSALTATARQHMVERYDLASVCLPAQARLIQDLLRTGRDTSARALA